ncbi:MAG TPA: HNH endonuclease [Saprospiraceae bacterium]|nr:HNH endonuclease [Saprospiraceae bacterium]
MANRWGIPKDVEEYVKQRDLFCIYCGIPFVNLLLTYKTRPTWEHIINDIRINDIDNIALCCGSCNASKGAKKVQVWLASKYCASKGITEDNVAPVVKKVLASQKNRPT